MRSQSCHEKVKCILKLQFHQTIHIFCLLVLTVSWDELGTGDHLVPNFSQGNYLDTQMECLGHSSLSTCYPWVGAPTHY